MTAQIMNTKVFSTLCVSLVTLSLSLTGCSKPSKPQASQQPTIQGRWSGFEDGSTAKVYISFTSNQFVYTDAHSNQLGSGTYVVNKEVVPPQMDLTFEQMESPEHEGKVGLAIYELTGNRLTIAGCEPGSGQRPTNLVSTHGVRVFTLGRE